MQAKVDEICLQTNFGGRDHSGFGDFAPFCLCVEPTLQPSLVSYFTTVG